MITMLGIFCGFLAIISAIKGNFHYAARCVMIAMILDGLDGRIARRLNATSEFGKEFDSLSDVIAFGVAPAVMVYCWAFSAHADEFGVLAAFLFVVCSATRLARFNIMPSDKALSGFVGLPTPGAAAAVVSVVHCFPAPVVSIWISAGLMAYMVFIGFLMVSTLPFLSIKKIELTSQSSRLGIVLVAFMVALSWKYFDVMLLFGSVGYAMSGVVAYLIKKNKQQKETGLEAKTEAVNS
jgi:CDP-diacylglycerol---serine O-phosphatidyltransferase